MSGPRSVSRTLWMDGELVPWEEATVHVLSHSLQRGSLVFDYLSVHEIEAPPEFGAGKVDAVFRLPEHAERMLESCRLVGLPIRRSADEIAEAVLETVAANPRAKAVKASAYLASVEVDVVPLDDHVTLCVAAYDPWEDVNRHKATTPKRTPTVKLHVEVERRNRREDIMPPQAKVAANYTSPMGAKWRARAEGYDEIVLVDEDGHVAETPTANLFLVAEDGALVTPPLRRVLAGVTRATVIEIAKHDGIVVREEPFTPEEMLAAPEVFLTGTTAGVWPVESIDRRPVGEGAPGPRTRALAERFAQVTSGSEPAFAHWLRIPPGVRAR